MDFRRWKKQISLDLQPNGFCIGKTTSEYFEKLKQQGYSDLFLNRILLPILSGVGTCKYSGSLTMPAELAMGYMSKPFSYSGTGTGSRRPIGGTKIIVDKLSEPIQKIRTGTTIKNIRNTEDGGVIVTHDEGEEIFDYVIIATPADKAVPIVPKEWKEIISCLKKVKYEYTEMILHKDKSFMPKKKSEWSPVNFTINDQFDPNDKPTATVWMNLIQEELRGEEDIFQTWAPHREPNDILFRWNFDRAVISQDGVDGVVDLENFQGHNNVFFVGSYAKYGIPLLESGIASAIYVAEKLQVKVDWKYKEGEDEEEVVQKSSFSFWLKIFIFIFLCYYFVRIFS